MALKDKEKWDRKHLEAPTTTEPVKLLRDYARLAMGRVALDIACGMGRNAKYLASLGFSVDALDISSTAIDSLQDIKNINAIEVDLDSYQLAHNHYDLIVCSYFLDRSLFPQIEDALKEGGILLYETYIYHPENESHQHNKKFLLEEGELEITFDDRYELLHIREWWDSDMNDKKIMKGSMVAKKKAGGMSVEDFWA